LTTPNSIYIDFGNEACQATLTPDHGRHSGFG
jgi:hypothetical protein